MTVRPTRLAVLAALALAAPLPAAHAQVQHAHVHGQAFADVAIDGGRVEIQLRATAHDLVGFERAAATPDEEARVLEARRTMLDHAALWQFNAVAGCVAEAPTLEVPGTKAEGHDHDHDHDHAHGDGHAHADWTARYAFTCANPSGLRAIETGLFDRFPSLEAVNVQLLDATGARGETLTPASRRLALAP
jgi:hypothetical protein